MAERGLVTAESFEFFARRGTFTRVPEWTWSALPSSVQWRNDLGHQLRLAIEPEEAAAFARDAWARAAG